MNIQKIMKILKKFIIIKRNIAETRSFYESKKRTFNNFFHFLHLFSISFIKKDY